MGKHEDSFVFLQKNELDNEKVALNQIRFGNHSLDKQFKRDIELISLAIVQCGSSPQDKSKADILLKSMLLLFFGHVCYRHRFNQRFRLFKTLDTYFEHSVFKHFPIAAILLHGSRILIEFPSDIASQFMDWLIVDKNSWRYMATHGISALPIAEKIDHQSVHTTYKFLKEEKVSGTTAALNLLSSSIVGLLNPYLTAAPSTQEKQNCAEHYGFDLALGGVGNEHFASKKIIQNNGEHGHLYIHFYKDPIQDKPAGILLGIEQSAPGKPDQYGGQHDLAVSDKEYSASGGDLFCKKPNLERYQAEYQGLTTLPFANYYDSLWNGITKETLILIEKSFYKCQCLLTLLPKEKALDFIRKLLTSPAGMQAQDFDELFGRYFREIPQSKDTVAILQQQLKRLTHEKQQLELEINRVKIEMQGQADAIKNQYSKELVSLHKQLDKLTVESDYVVENNRELMDEILRQREQISQLQNDQHIFLMVNQSYQFMQTVIQQMGWFANKSQKKNILIALQQKTLEQRINCEQLSYLLKNFISVSLMNRHYFNHETHSAKACLLNLNLPYYQPLARLLKLPHNSQYAHLLDLVSNNDVEKSYYISAKYKKNLYRFYQNDDTEKSQLSENRLNLATQHIIYQLEI